MSYFDDDENGGMVYGQVDDATLQQVEAIVNVDIEMLVSSPYPALRCPHVNVNAKQPPPAHMFYLVVDTNILIHYLDTLQQFVEDCERELAPVIVIVPGIVVSELDW